MRMTTGNTGLVHTVTRESGCATAYTTKGMIILLEFRNFSKTYKGGKRAVDDLCLTIEAGDIYGFIGHNGAGKTTSLKAACGILDFTEGDILIDGISVREEP